MTLVRVVHGHGHHRLRLKRVSPIIALLERSLVASHVNGDVALSFGTLQVDVDLLIQQDDVIDDDVGDQVAVTHLLAPAT